MFHSIVLGSVLLTAMSGAAADNAAPAQRPKSVQPSATYVSVYDDSPSARGVGDRPGPKIHRILARKLEKTPGDQAVKAWVLFKDKGITSRSAYSSAIDALASTYGHRAIERRERRRTRPGLFDEYDLPVVPGYITQVEATGARVHVVSKWVNGISVYATAAQLEQIDQLSFVKIIQPVRHARRIEPVKDRETSVERAADAMSGVAMGGGDTCASATVIPGVPYNDTGTTIGFADDYDEACQPGGGGSPDVVYSYTPASDITVDIQLCNGSDFYTELYVYETVCPDGGPFACSEQCAAPESYSSSVVFNLALTGGNTYYIVIDGREGWDGNYTLDMTEATVYGRANDQLTEINLIAVHDLGFTGKDVIVGLLDTGFWTTHEAFNDPVHPLNIVAAWDFVDDDADVGSGSHGTQVLSIIGAYKPDKLIGGAYGASFILCRTEDVYAEYRGEEDNYVAGLEFIEANGGDMATASLSYLEFDDPEDSYTQEDLDGLTAICTIGVNVATSNGMHCCNSAGNNGNDSDPATSHLGAPADAFELIAIGAVYSTGEITGFSSDGPTADGRVKPEVLARGSNTRMVNPADDTAYTHGPGTSYSGPLVAGVVACLIDAHPNWTVDKMRETLFETADYFVANGTFDPEYVRGYGIIDALAALQVAIETVTVGNPGNAGELSGAGAGGDGPDRICGAVDYVYNIGKFEVTAGQYTDFLNAVAATDTYGLYNPSMNVEAYGCQITRSGNTGSYTYDFSGRPDGTEADWIDRPVNYVSWGDAARLCNWLHNGQPSGAQDLSTTEDGSYYLNGAMSSAEMSSVVREEDATWVIPSEDEWYKAAYHKNDGVTGNYWDYPTQSDTAPTPEAPPGVDMANGSADYYNGGFVIPTYYRTKVGAYYAKPSDSPYGTFDQGGNVWEWNEAVIDSYRGLCGGSFTHNNTDLHAAYRIYEGPSMEYSYIGFRVADVSSDCGNGVVEFGEECDDGNQNDNDICLSTCEINPSIPTLSEWGLVALALLVLSAGTVVMLRRRRSERFSV